MSGEWASVGRAQTIGQRLSQQDFVDHVLLPPHGEGEDRLLVVLADGMGGHAGGELASRAAVEGFMAEVQGCSRAPAAEILERGMRSAAAGVQKAAAADRAAADMGTTLVAGVLEKGADGVRVRWVSVGDSPLWRVRKNGALERLNADQSLAGALEAELRAGKVTPEQAAEDPRRHQANVLTHALTGEPFDLAHADMPGEAVRLEAGDLVLFATDGVESLDDERIGAVVRRRRSAGAQAAADALLRRVIALKRKNQDNATLVLVDPGGERRRGWF